MRITADHDYKEKTIDLATNHRYFPAVLQATEVSMYRKYLLYYTFHHFRTATGWSYSDFEALPPNIIRTSRSLRFCLTQPIVCDSRRA